MIDPKKLEYFRTRKAAVSYQTLAKAAGVAYRTVFNAEKGLHPTNLETIRKLAKGLTDLIGEKISPEDLMLDEKDSPVVELAGVA